MIKRSLYFFFLLILNITSSYCQVTNLTVAGSNSTFTITSGDEFGWSFDVTDAGDTTLIQIWVDADQNGLLNPSVDVLWIFFNHVDGDPEGQNGPPDIDGSANKSVSFMGMLGLAPAHYILLFKNRNNYQTFTGIVNSLSSPAVTVSGSVSVPAGYSKKNIILSLENKSEEGVMFWTALTDENGNFAVQLNSDSTVNAWDLITNNNFLFGSAVVSPREYSIELKPGISVYSGNDFTFTASSASINGYLKDEFGNPYIGSEVYFNTNDGALNRYTQTDTAGFFNLGLLSNELPQSNLTLAAGSNHDADIVSGFYSIPSIKSGDVIDHDLTIFNTDTTIKGRVTIDGNSPNMGMQLYCMNSDTGYVNTYTDGNGYFTFRVSSKIFNYKIGVANGPSFTYNASILVHPGESDVTLNILTTDIRQHQLNNPAEYSLSQNYPNPFNPVTYINYSLAKEGYVRLTVYNLTGSKVATLVNENKHAGNYSVQFNGAGLASGIYYYRLEAGNFTSERKLILLK